MLFRKLTVSHFVSSNLHCAMSNVSFLKNYLDIIYLLTKIITKDDAANHIRLLSLLNLFQTQLQICVKNNSIENDDNMVTFPKILLNKFAMTLIAIERTKVKQFYYFEKSAKKTNNNMVHIAGGSKRRKLSIFGGYVHNIYGRIA